MAHPRPMGQMLTELPFAVRFLLAPAAVAAGVVLLLMWRRRARARPGMVGRFDPAGIALLGALVVGDLLEPDPWGGGLAAFLAPAAVLCLSQFIGSFLGRAWLAWLPAAALVAAWMPAYGVLVTSVKPPFTSSFVSLGSTGILVTMFWILLCIWAFMSAREAPGVCLGVGGIASLGFAAACLLQPRATDERAIVLASVVAAGCLGAVLGWWPHRAVSPASGALIVGFLIGNVSILGALKNTAFLIVVLPLLLLGAPLLNATYALAYGRRREGTGLAIEVRHQRLHEVLFAQGYSPGQVLLLFMLGSAYLTALAVVLVVLIEWSYLAKTAILFVALPVGGVAVYSVAKLLPRQREKPPSEKLRAWDVAVSPVTMDEAIEAIDGYIRSREPHQVVTAAASTVVRAHEDEELGTIMREAAMVAADGAGVVWMARMLDLPIDERVSGCDMVVRVCEMASEKGYSVYLLGGRPGVAQEAAEELRRRSPGLEVVGTEHGYFEPEEEGDIIAHIRRQRPDVLFVALGIPRQEKWIRAHLEEVGVPVCIGVGGSFDVISGRVRRAPEWMRRCGLEWLWRTAREPRRLPRLLALPKLLLMTLRAAVRRESDGQV
ncbi:MAG: WecB/TagA/CpsF family glycosyltransferase [Armatimonadota bacterium]